MDIAETEKLVFIDSKRGSSRVLLRVTSIISINKTKEVQITGGALTERSAQLPLL